jgi:hypothetical protein
MYGRGLFKFEEKENDKKIIIWEVKTKKTYIKEN